jgi:MATE family multidrug resistance protein
VTTTRTEFLATARLALPIAIGLAGHGLMTSLDSAFLGHHSTAALAACGLGVNVHLPLLLFGYGLVTGVSVLSAQGRGAGDFSAAPRALRAGLGLSLAYGVAIAALIHLALIAGLMRLSGLPEPVLREAHGFLVALAWSTPFSLVFQSLKNSAEADNRPWRPLYWLLAGLALNALLCWLLIFGKCGFPELGAFGAGLATFAGRLLMLAGLAWQERDMLRGAFSETAKGGMRAMIDFGIPCAIHWTAEVGVFCAAPLIIGRSFGAESLAAYQIAVSVAGLAFMLPLGISQAAGIRAGEAFGAKDFPRLKLIGRGALGFALAFMGVYAVFVAGAHRVIPQIFIGADGSAATLTIAANLLLVAAVFALADGVQVTAAGLLRGLGDARFASGVGLVAYWVVGLPFGLFLAFTCGMKALGIWVGLAAGLFFAAALFSWRWRERLGKFAA